MSASAGSPGALATQAMPPIPLGRRLYGLGSIYGKTIRDSRLSFTIAAGLLGGMALVMGLAVSNIFPTPAARLQVDQLFGSVPEAMLSLFGNVGAIGAKVGTLGGYVTFKYAAIFALGTATWSVMALSGTLAGEARRGSLDFVAAAPFGKRRIALEKLAAHLTGLWFAMVVLALMTTLSSNLFGNAELGDRISPLASAGFAAWIGLLAMAFGGLALVLSPLLGRAGGAGIAGLVLAVTWLANGLGIGGPLLALSPFAWTFGHVPLVGIYDWPALALLAVVAGALLGLGVELFARRDLGVTAGLSLPGLPVALLGVGGPVSRAFGDQLPRALSWGIGIGLVGVLYTALAGSLASTIVASGIGAAFGSIFPNADFTSVGGWMQFYAELLFIAAGFAGATFVARWAVDEAEGRLEVALTAPLGRSRWLLAGGVGALLAVVVTTLLFTLGVGVGAAIGGLGGLGDALLGCASLGLYAAAIVGVGFAVGGLWRSSLAAEIAALVVVATYLLDLVAPPLELPDWLHQLALTAHFGRPMIGEWDLVGVAVSLVLAFGGIALGAWGMSRRDVAR